MNRQADAVEPKNSHEGFFWRVFREDCDAGEDHWSLLAVYYRLSLAVLYIESVGRMWCIALYALGREIALLYRHYSDTWEIQTTGADHAGHELCRECKQDKHGLAFGVYGPRPEGEEGQMLVRTLAQPCQRKTHSRKSRNTWQVLIIA